MKINKLGKTKNGAQKSLKEKAPIDELKSLKRKGRMKMAGVAAGGSVLFLILLALITLSSVSEEVALEGLNDDVSTTRQLEFGLGEYLGETAHGNMNGEGVFEFNTGEQYEGEWDTNQMDGNGTFRYTTGSYEGEFEESDREGVGTFKWDDGAVYKGSWENDCLSGTGVLTTKDKAVFDGTFSDNAFYSGELKIDNNKEKCTIEFSEGSPGKIDAEFDNGDKYTGEFSLKDSTIEGKGKMSFKGVGSYNGSYDNGLRSGQGKFTWKDGSYYQGQWKKDKMSGEGKYYFSDDEYLEGTFKNNQPTGTCTFHKDGDTYTTKWKDGKCVSIEED